MPKDAAYRKAEKKIEKALKSGATILNLHDMKLTELPESIGQLTQLANLNLGDNHLTKLPESIGKLSQLNYLTIHNNEI